MSLSVLGLAAPSAGGIMSLLPTLLMFGALIYFMVIRPQKKRQQNAKSLLDSIVVGDTIQTIGGFIGDVTAVSGDDFLIVSEGTKLRIKKNAVAIKVNASETVEVASSNVVEEDEDDFKIDDFEI